MVAGGLENIGSDGVLVVVATEASALEDPNWKSGLEEVDVGAVLDAKKPELLAEAVAPKKEAVVVGREVWIEEPKRGLLLPNPSEVVDGVDLFIPKANGAETGKVLAVVVGKEALEVVWVGGGAVETDFDMVNEEPKLGADVVDRDWLAVAPNLKPPKELGAENMGLVGRLEDRMVDEDGLNPPSGAASEAGESYL